MDQRHILLLGSTGGCGLEFLRQYHTIDSAQKPYLTIYARSTSMIKLQDTRPSLFVQPKVRIVQGALSEPSVVEEAFNVDEAKFPTIDTVVSFLGPGLSLTKVLTRSSSTELSDAFKTVLLPAFKRHHVKRLLVLSTPSSTLVPGEYQKLSWDWWFLVYVMPRVFAPEGYLELKEMADLVTQAPVDWTVFRVPRLLDQLDQKQVVVTEKLGPDYRGDWQLSRSGLVEWLFSEIAENKYIRRTVFVGNKTQKIAI